MAVGDFNGDGKLDLAVTNRGVCCDSPGTVSILLGDGTGNFTLASSPGVGRTPTSVAVGDFNGDGKLDLAVAADRVGHGFRLAGRWNGPLHSGLVSGCGRRQLSGGGRFQRRRQAGPGGYQLRRQHGFHPAGGRNGQLHLGLVPGYGHVARLGGGGRFQRGWQARLGGH